MSDLVQINLRAGKEQKARWEAYIEEAGRFNSLSELIRASVEAELAGHENEQSDLSPAVANDIQDLKDELTAVRKNVAWLREQSQGEVDISELAQAVFDALAALPPAPEPIQVPEDVDMDRDEYEQHLRAERAIEPSDADDRSPQTAGAIAERVGSTPKRVEDAIDHLQDQFLPVTAIEYDGGVHYFTEE